MERADGGEDARCPDYPAEAQDPEHEEPEQHDRAENAADEPRPFPLNDEQREQDGEGERHDHWFQPGRVDTQTLDGAQHRDGGRIAPSP